MTTKQRVLARLEEKRGEAVSGEVLARSLGVELICTTICSPYYNPHFQRPAYYPVSDGYLPPEEPIIGAARQINAVAQLKKHFENTGMLFIGAGYTCLQEYLTQVGQARRKNRLRRHRPHGARLPGASGGYPRRMSAELPPHLPHVRRLHDRAAQRHGFGLLSA